MKNFTKYILAVLFLLTVSPVFAQSIYSIKLHLTDAKTSEPVAFATASVTVKGEKSPLKYTLTDDKGNAVIAKLKRGTYILKAELMGYKTYVKEVTLEKNMDLGVIKMAEDAEVLEAAKVTDVGNPIVIKKDTVEYNASSFKTSDNDMLEELLKKLPGVEVGTDGSITANGETIKKITIDGKTFFLDDPQLASKNIPAKIIEKVKVVEKKSDQAMFTGIDDGEEETIIDLKLRPGMATGWFGNVMAGGGHDIPGAGSDMNDWRYQGAAMIGRFVEGSQISLILNGNNTNNRGFNDIAGSMMGNMRGGRGMGRGQGGWGGGNGISNTWMGGLNGAFDLCDGDMELSGNYLYNGSDKNVEVNSIETKYRQNSRSIETSTDFDNTFSQGHRFGVRLDHKFSENTSILFEPQVNFGTGHFSEYSKFSTDSIANGATEAGKVNSGLSNNTGRNKNWSTSGFLLFRQKLGKQGRTLSANIRYSFSNNLLDGFNQSITDVYDEKGNVVSARSKIVNQRYDQNSNSMSLSSRVVYTEPLTEHLFMEANYHYSWNLNKSLKDTYRSGSDNIVNGLPVFDTQGEFRDGTYSNSIRNESHNHRAGLSLSYQLKKFRANLGVTANPTNTYNETNGKIYTDEVTHWSPQAMVFYEINDNTNLRFFYFGRSAQPTTSQLMPVPDNSNPTSISLGNTYLKPYFNHNIRARFGYTNKKTFTSVNANIRGSVVQNAITNAEWADSDNTTYSVPVNGPATTSLNGRFFVNSPFGKSDFSIFSMTFLNYSGSVSYVGTELFENTEANTYYDKTTAEFDYERFFGKYMDMEDHPDMFITNRVRTLGFTQRLRFTYRNDFVEINLGGRTNMNKPWRTVKSGNENATWNNQADGSMNWTIPGGINIIAEANYNWYNGYDYARDDEIILNAEITKLLFKKKFTIALKAYDILGQSKTLAVTDKDNSHTETISNTLGRYIILSLTYRFGNFNQGGGQRRGPGGPHGGFGGPRR